MTGGIESQLHNRSIFLRMLLDGIEAQNTLYFRVTESLFTTLSVIPQSSEAAQFTVLLKSAGGN